MMLTSQIVDRRALFLYTAKHRTHRAAKFIRRLLVGVLISPLYQFPFTATRSPQMLLGYISHL
jgi:hypothetical protein